MSIAKPRDAETADRSVALSRMSVSRETERHLATYVDRLRDWQRVKNLVAPSTLDQVWTRHIADSAQLPALAPDALRWTDLGSGAGFPGLVVAIMLLGRPGAMVHLIESNARKCAFLREVTRLTGAPATVHAERIETVLPRLGPIDVVTSRALAPLPDLIAHARSLLDCGAMGLFLSGEQGAEHGDSDVSAALAHYAIEALPSRTHDRARILRVMRAAPGDRPAAATAGAGVAPPER